MGKCFYCGESAGFLSRRHKVCEQKNKEGQLAIIAKTRETLTGSNAYHQLQDSIQATAKNCFISELDIPFLLAKGYDEAVENFLDDGLLTQEEETNAAMFKNFFTIQQDIINKNGSLEKIVKASVLRDLTEGKIPAQRLNIEGGVLPFNFQKGEQLVWVFTSVEFYEQNVKTHYEGGSSGISIKIAKGVYYRTSSFKGHPVKTTEMARVASGILAFTDKHLYFGSSIRNFRIPYSKIVTFQPYEDGLGIQKDAASAKPQVFKNLDGWFTYNLVQNIVQL
jgi:hypothetical protein